MQESLFKDIELKEVVSPPLQQCSVSRCTLLLGDCLIESDKIETGSIDLIVTDLPYGTIKGAKFYDYANGCEWDEVIPPEKIMKISERVLRRNGKLVLFAQQPFSTNLINNSIPNLPYCYTLIWEKDSFANPLITSKAPVNYYEEILVFRKGNQGDFGSDNTYREYLNSERKKAKLTLDEMCGICGLNTKGHGGAAYHWCSSKQPQLIPEHHYIKLREETGFFQKEYSELKEIHKKSFQKDISIFNLNGEKHKSNILKFKKDYDGYHPTQKPVALLEDLILTYSNENNTVLDFTMGSGSTGVAALKNNRHFIGIEKEKKYYDIAVKRCSQYSG